MPTDEEIDDRIAEEVAARIEASHPHASESFRRKLVKLYVAQALGMATRPGRITARELAGWLELSRQSVSLAEKMGLARAWKAYHSKYPHLIDAEAPSTKHEALSTKH